MPAPPIPMANNDIIEMRIYQRYQGNRMLNVFHYRVSMSGTAVDFPTSVTAAHAWNVGSAGLATKINATQNDECTQTRINYQIIKPTRYHFLEKEGLGAGKRDQAELGGGAPANVDAVITRHGNLALKGGSSNSHIGGLVNSDVSFGVIQLPVSLLLAQIGTAAKTDITAGSGVTWRPIILHKADVGLSQLVADYLLQGTARVMRRRTVGVGE